MKTVSGRYYLIVASALMTVIFICANLLAQPRLAGARIDFTDTGLYTLSDGTRAAMKSLAEPVDITFVYASRVGQDYPAVRAYAARIREMLDAYGAIAGRRLHIDEINPTPFSEAEDTALAAGMTAVDTQGGDPLYFGIIGRNEVDDLRTLPFLAPERESTLEYDLTRLIMRLDRPDMKTIAVLSSLQGMSGDGQGAGYSVLQEMAKSFSLIQLPDDFIAIPGETDVLMIAHPPALTDTQLYAIDQYILAGGRALVLVDPASRAAMAGGVMNISDSPLRSDIGKLSEHWGIQLAADAIADASHALPVETAGGDGRLTVIGQPLYIAVPPADMSETDPVTSELSRSVNFGAPGAFEVTPIAGINVTPLVKTGPAPSWIDASAAARDMSPADVVKAYEALDGPRLLAVRLTGNLPTAFPNGRPPSDLDADSVPAELTRIQADADRPHRRVSASEANIILVADADILDDGFYINPNGAAEIADNAVFILNALDNLSGGSELVTLRSRSPGLRPMTRVVSMREAAQDVYFDEQARLEARLSEAQKRLEELQEIGAAGGFFNGDLTADLTPAEQAELLRLRERIVATRSRLRSIERDFRHDIDRLEGRLKAINIWGGPLLVSLAGLFVWYRRRRTDP